MSIDEVISYFGNLHAACIALEIKVPNMTLWKKQGYIPYKQQFRLAVLTKWELKPDEKDPASLLREKKKLC